MASIRFIDGQWSFNGKMMVFDLFSYFISPKQISLLTGIHCASGAINTFEYTEVTLGIRIFVVLKPIETGF